MNISSFLASLRRVITLFSNVKWLLVLSSIILFLSFAWWMGGSVSSSKKMSMPTILPTSAHKATVIFLHGLGDTGHGWLASFAEIIPKNVKCICPNAPNKPVTLNAGMVMPSWFDIRSLSFSGPEDEAGIKASSNTLKELIAAEEKNGIPSTSIVIGGFSQGGAVALYTALTTSRPLGGVIALSTWLPMHAQFPGFIEGNRETPFFQGHGNMDPMVNYSFGQLTATKLNTQCTNHLFRTYSNMGHSSCPQEMSDVQQFLAEVLPGGN